MTTEFVLLEVANFFCHPAGRRTFKTLTEALAVAEDVTIVPASAELSVKGLTLFHARPDKAWSLTDCISFVVMDEMSLTDALTADHHFEQAGFNALLK